jgi:hypothetical protein
VGKKSLGLAEDITARLGKAGISIWNHN